jgi:hypothetical protein
MKNIIKILLTLMPLWLLVNCEEEQKLFTYPESYPVFEGAQVIEEVITYDDSISLSVQLSDVVTPLSTLEVQVVLNNEVITSESVRTKGNTSEVNRKYHIPFGPNVQDNVAVKVYLTSINVDGFSTDTILNSTTVKRPVINELYIVPTSGETFRLDMIDSTNLIFYTDGMTYGPSVSYLLATKITRFKKVDWTGLVFGMTANGIGFTQSNKDVITDEDATIIGISEITFDAMQLTRTVGGKLLEPVTTLDINEDLNPMVMAGENFLGNNVFFGTDIEVTFTGLTNLANSLAPDYFEITGENTARFVGPTAIYKAYYFIEGNYLYVEPQPDVKHPEALWVCGTGLGRPSSPYAITSSWNWNTPFDYVPCMKVSEGIYQFTAYMKNTADGTGTGTLDFKFFYQRGWTQEPVPPVTEVNASEYTVGEPLFGLWIEGKYGNVNGGATPFEGVYQVTIDMNAKTITSVKLN